MKELIKIEEAFLFLGCLVLILIFPYKIFWWQYILLFFMPDIGIAAYLVNNKVGAICYNIFHHKAIAVVLCIAGYILANNFILLIGLLFLAHASFDRIFGFGLKYFDDFKHTSIGMIK